MIIFLSHTQNNRLKIKTLEYQYHNTSIWGKWFCQQFLSYFNRKFLVYCNMNSLKVILGNVLM